MAADPQVVDYIKKAREAGQSDSQTRQILLKNGWLDSEVTESISQIDGAPAQAQEQQPTPQVFSQPKPQPQNPVQQQQPRQSQQPQYQQRTQFQQPRQQEAKPQYTQPQPAATAQQPKPQPQAQPAQNYKPDYANYRPKSHLFGKILISLLVLVVLGGAGFGAYLFLNKKPAIVNPSGQEQTKSSLANQFAKYEYQSTKVTPAVPDYTLTLADVTNLSNFEKSQKVTFTAAQKQSLEKNNFFITKNFDKFYNADSNGYSSRNDDWTALYSSIGGGAIWDRAPQNSVYISSDFLLHVYHKLVENDFEYIEQVNFYPQLFSLSTSLLKSSADNYNSSAAGLQKDSYDRLSAYFLVASSLLDVAQADYNKFKEQYFIDDNASDTQSVAVKTAEALAKSNAVSDNALNIAKQELALIFSAKDIVSSPLMGKFQGESMKEDYTQFTPRSHYAKNAVLRSYFRAMMWYGRMNFVLKSAELTRDAINIDFLMQDASLSKQWQSIYLPTTFFVGQSDDLTLYEYTQALKKVGAVKMSDSGNVVTSLQTELKNYRNPQIMSSAVVGEDVLSTTKEDLQKSTKGFRFMGQRFTPDAFIFSSLTQGDEAPNPKTGQKLPSTPTALMVSTLMGSKTSADLLKIWIKDNAPDSDKVIGNRMTDLNTYFSKTSQDQWTQNIYWSWIYTLKSLFNESSTKTGYPMFVKNTDWNLKSLQSFLGSWTELKHDTLLYAKQSYAELGAGGDDKPAAAVVKGYVEPNVQFFDRLEALVKLTTDGLKNLNLLNENMQARHDRFSQSLAFYKKIAVAELQNEKISDEDFETLRLDAGQLDYILSPLMPSVVLEKNARSALIADVHTDVKKGQILYEANGVPNYIYVAIKDANGTRLTKGLVYSYYEFTNPLTKRLTDQTWQKWVYSDTVKKLTLPFWTQGLIK